MLQRPSTIAGASVRHQAKLWFTLQVTSVTPGAAGRAAACIVQCEANRLACTSIAADLDRCLMF